jgi:hypothetical protein
MNGVYSGTLSQSPAPSVQSLHHLSDKTYYSGPLYLWVLHHRFNKQQVENTGDKLHLYWTCADFSSCHCSLNNTVQQADSTYVVSGVISHLEVI